MRPVSCSCSVLAALMLLAPFLFSAGPRERSLDHGWRFLRGDAPGAEKAAFDDSGWRELDVPHDWSIEDLPARNEVVPEVEAVSGTWRFRPGDNPGWQAPVFDDSGWQTVAVALDGAHGGGMVAAGVKSERIGPFDAAESPGKHFTGNTIGGIGWYRKHFTLNESNKLVAVRFDGVYMNSVVWINGHRLGEHPHGYTAFAFDLTPFLNPAGEENVLAVKVRNEGRNSRWYSGSGIYRRVWLTVTDPVHVPSGGVFVTTPEVSREHALVSISSEVENTLEKDLTVSVLVRILDRNGKLIGSKVGRLRLPANGTRAIQQAIEVESPQLWSVDSPTLYTAEVEVSSGGKSVDDVSIPFGIRSLEFTPRRGFLLNGESLLLQGGCIHHDNGALGAAAIDRAEERKIELLKANGYNAIRSAHNPPSSALLDACDRLGMLVIDEAFDQWNEAKEHNAQDYHRFFDEWCERDIASMVRRDRNHPSIIMWSIGNEIPEQFHPGDTGMRLRREVLSHDSTRPVTQAIWGISLPNWDAISDPAFTHLDVGGYNYLPDKYASDHARHPERIMYGSESFPKDAFLYWSLAEELPYVLGDFVWTAMDYLGEAGLAHALLSDEKDSFFMPWPWFNAWCGDLDLCGFKKPQSYYRDVVWRRSPIEMAVHAPIPPGLSEVISWWGWPNESRSWNWSGHEGTPLQVSVYTRCDAVRLELAGEVVGESPVSKESKLTATFEVPYAPGELRAYGLKDGKVVAETSLATTGPPARLQLTADRANIRADRSDLAYVTVEVVDTRGRRVPNAEVRVRFTVSGAGELAGHASAVPNEPASFREPVRETYEGRCLAILRPTGDVGAITLRAEADGLKADATTVQAH